ncbi:sel1 repeat family protein, partial [Acinetobacter baumannii]|nr:sel1 repeat family protein [Acinetobacter baumannii]
MNKLTNIFMALGVCLSMETFA